jgi:hypothetical protein
LIIVDGQPHAPRGKSLEGDWRNAVAADAREVDKRAIDPDANLPCDHRGLVVVASAWLAFYAIAAYAIAAYAIAAITSLLLPEN